MAMVPKQPGTLESVARVAGVSKQTVSNVLNAPGRVKAETRAKVLEAIASEKYVPSAAARQLRTGKSRTLGMRLHPSSDGVSGVVHDQFLHAFTESAQKAGYRITLFTAPDPTAEIRAFEELRAVSNVDGFMVIGTQRHDARLTWLSQHNIPFVSFGRDWDDDNASHDWVDVDGAAGTREATEHLIAAGHAKIAFLGWPGEDALVEDRRQGWQSAMSAAGLDALNISCVEDVSAARATMADVMSRHDLTAVVCASDTLALGAYESAKTADGQLEVIGFDDSPVIRALGISSVAQPYIGVAEAAMDAMRWRLEQGDAPPRHVLLPPKLKVRSRI
jgi:DNA-binding LacI/PurR family transcriptional regulator